MLKQEEINKIKEIGEQLRCSIDKETGKMAFEKVYNQHKDFFSDKGGWNGFVESMRVCAVFFASRGERTIKDRENTEYVYI